MASGANNYNLLEWIHRVLPQTASKEASWLPAALGAVAGEAGGALGTMAGYKSYGWLKNLAKRFGRDISDDKAKMLSGMLLGTGTGVAGGFAGNLLGQKKKKKQEEEQQAQDSKTASVGSAIVAGIAGEAGGAIGTLGGHKAWKAIQRVAAKMGKTITEDQAKMIGGVLGGVGGGLAGNVAAHIAEKKNEEFPKTKSTEDDQEERLQHPHIKAADEEFPSLGIRDQEEEIMRKKAQPIDPEQPMQPMQPEGFAAPVDRTQQRQTEMEAWQRWTQDRNPNDFKFLLDSYRPFIYSMGRRYIETAQLPRSTLEADLIQHFHRAMETYDPNKGAQLHTHVANHLQHTGRFIRTYTNIGKIPEPRARQIGMFESRTVALQDMLGREPSTSELADDLGIDQKDIELLRKEIRKDIIIDPTTESMSDIAEVTPKALEQLTFLHSELNPEQQTILEHTYGMFGRQPVDTNEDLARVLNMTPQKVRAIKRQIAKRLEKRYF